MTNSCADRSAAVTAVASLPGQANCNVAWTGEDGLPTGAGSGGQRLHDRCSGRAPFKQRKDRCDHHRVLDAGNNVGGAARFAYFDIDLKHTIQTLCLTLIDAWLVAGGEAWGAALGRPHFAGVTCSHRLLLSVNTRHGMSSHEVSAPWPPAQRM